MNRPILTLNEDFAALGLVDKEETSLDEMSPDQLAADFAKRMKKAKKKGKTNLNPPPKMEDADDDGDNLDEVQQQRVIKQRGAGVQKKHQQARIYAKTHKAQKRIAAHKPKAMRSRKFLAGKPKARRGYKRVGLKSDVDLGNLGGTIQSLGEVTNTAQLQQAFSNVYKLGRTIGESYADLIEDDYISKYVSYPTMQESAILMAKEAQHFAHALSEHEGFLKVADQNLLQDHAERMAAHLEELGEVLSDTKTAIAIDEGTFDPEVHDIELAELFGVPVEESDFSDDDDDLFEMEQKHGEKTMAPIHGWGSEPKEHIFTVMDPLGIAKVGHREKLVLATQVPRESTEDEDVDGDPMDEDDTETDDHFWKL